MQNMGIFLKIGITATKLSLKNIDEENAFITKGYDIEIKVTEDIGIKKASGIKIMPLDIQQGIISSCFFEREDEIQLNAETETALEFAKQIIADLQGQYPVISFSTNLL